MVFPIVGGTQLTGDFVTNSLRLNDDDSPYLERSLSSPNTDKFTVSCWVKLSGARSQIANIGKRLTGEAGDNRSIDIEQGSTGRLGISAYNGVADSNVAAYNSNTGEGALIRDPSAWYHFVYAFDTGQGTAANRFKWYINGVLQSGYNTTTTPSQNADLFDSSGSGFRLGRAYNTESRYSDMYVAEYYYVDGQQYDHTYFGEFDNNGVWVPVKNGQGAGGAITFGTNGFYLQFKETGTSANASGIGADTSGNDNHLTPNNLAAQDITTDTPQNNFNTLNPLVPHHSIFDAETEGNTGLSSSGVQLRGGYMGSTIMPTSGKWYFEVNILSISGSSDRTGIAIPRFESVTGDDHIEGGDYAGFTVSTGSIGRVFVTEGSSTTETDNSEYVFNGASVAIFAVDMDASTPRVYVGKNGTWFTTSAGSGGNPATNTGYFEANLSTGGSGFSVGARHSAGSSAAQSYLYNFGQPAYTISSGNSDANGYGNFEYAVPSGYYAICTKNLAEFG